MKVQMITDQDVADSISRKMDRIMLLMETAIEDGDKREHDRLYRDFNTLNAAHYIFAYPEAGE